MAARTLVTGASGTLGLLLMPRLGAAGHTIRAMSRRPPNGSSASSGPQTEWVQADLLEPHTLARTLAEVSLVIHCASAPRHDDRMAHNLIDAARRAGSPHIVYVSIVGCDRIPLGFYRRKAECERALTESGLPLTIQRATQFHELFVRLFELQRRLPVLVLPSKTRFQPVAAAEVADRLIAAAGSGASGRLPDLGGPEAVAGAVLARCYLRATGRRRVITPLRIPGSVGAALRAGDNLSPDHPDGRMTFGEFVAAGLSRA
jgi:uncharacterized protein YbjT (DUF2867 family)